MTAVVFPATPAPPRATVRDWGALAVLMLPVLLVSIDGTVLGFALPSIAATLGPTAAQQLWIIDVYPLVLAGLLVSMGSLGDRFGRRRLLLLGATGFAAMSVVAAYSPTAVALIAARAGLGFFGAMLMPSTLSLLRNIFADPQQRRLAIAVWASFFAAGAALGPIVGGFLLEHFWWGSVFLMAVPVLIPLLVLAPIFVPESRDPNPGRIDPVSIALSLLALTPIVYAVKSLAKGGDVLSVVLPLAVGVVATALFIRRQLHRPDPMLDVRLFTNRRFSGAVAVNLLSVFSLVGFMFFVSQHLQLVVGMSPMDAGWALVPGLITMMVAGLYVVRAVRWIAPSTVVVWGMLASAAAYAVVAAFASPESTLAVLIAFAMLGVGIGAAETLSNDMIVSSVPAEKAGAASAVSETAYELGSVLGTAVLGSILAGAYAANLVLPAGVTGAQADTAAETLAGAHHTAAQLPADTAAALIDSAGHAFDAGVTVTSAIGVGLMLVAAWIAHRTLREPSSSAERTAAQ
ncbi:MFS transporter [Tsukamurella pseudospumae]|uniref:MFS transporter n=1 Tax=Tsukamurella pseudospumae TaxID=239498 RepID=A0A137ZMT1_9ACTN|nr:MFS transporter [Tsukamurella pseudospumae]KXO99504.1 MFS transporter [Tsukamurella pseudospumae]